MAATRKKRLAAVDEPITLADAPDPERQEELERWMRGHPSAALSFPLLNYVEDLLQKHEREDVPQARLAMVVARRLDVPGLETGASIVSLSKELDRLLGVALAGVNIESDELNELEKRRRAKAAQA